MYKNDVIRAVQDQMLPFAFTPSVVNTMYKDYERMSLFTFCLNIFAFRIYISYSEPGFNLDSFTRVSQTVFPPRFNFITQQSKVPE